jgi:hypothetical protein
MYVVTPSGWEQTTDHLDASPVVQTIIPQDAFSSGTFWRLWQ